MKAMVGISTRMILLILMMMKMIFMVPAQFALTQRSRENL